MDVRNQVAVITGAAGHLGQAVATAFAAAGASRAFLDPTAAPLAKVPTAGAGDVLRQRVDLADPASIAAAVDAAVARFGRIDALCNLAGGFQMGDKVHELTADKWTYMMELNAGS